MASREKPTTSAATEKTPLPPVSEMVERVARAIFAEGYSDCAPCEFENEIWPDVWPDQRRWHIAYARAAIEAMREPTEAMMKAMQESGVFDEVNGMISYCHARGSHRGGLTKAPMPAAYTIMIDAALGPEAASPATGSVQATDEP